MDEWIREAVEEIIDLDINGVYDPHDPHSRCAIEAIIKSHLPTGEVFTIKPLRWEQVGESIVAKTMRYDYQVYQLRSGQWVWDVWADNLRQDDGEHCASPEEGKALAEAHWQSYLKQGLEVVGGTNKKTETT